jgi:hypothetical protein
MEDQKFKIGDLVRITKRIQGHGFEIGEVATLTNIDPRGNKAVGKKSFWFVRDEEIELVVRDKPDFKAWLDEKITTLIQLDTDTSKLQEVKRIFNLYLNSLK